MKRAVIFSGAGLSADSGIKTFRDPNGLWEQHQVQDVAYHEAWWKKCDADGPVVLGDLCPKCGGQMRPDLVWFGEDVDLDFDRIHEWCHDVKYGDGIFICVGTSAQVQPAASLVSLFSQVENKFIVDLKPPEVADYSVLKGPAREQLPVLVNRLLDGQAE
jgi:NAD-dependent SIR2 family protein deacetylase